MDSKTAIEKNIDAAIAVHIRMSGATQAEVAKQVGLSEVQFSRKRRGDAEWKLDEFLKVCDITGRKPSELTTVNAW